MELSRMLFLRRTSVCAALVFPLALAGPAIASAVDPPPPPPAAGALVVDGHDATETYAGPVSLHTDHAGMVCGGTLIDRDWVLTAAHCAYASPEPPYPPRATGDMFLRYGTPWRATGPTTRVDQVVVHPGWNWAHDPGPVDDLALIHLATPIEAEPATMAGTAPAPGQPVRALGWGRTDPAGQGPLSDHLQQAEMTVTGDEQCGPAFGAATELCLGPENPSSAGVCFGDSGSPILTRQTGQWQLAALTSRSGAENTPTPCDARPDIGTDVTAYADWIEAIIHS